MNKKLLDCKEILCRIILLSRTEKRVRIALGIVLIFCLYIVARLIIAYAEPAQIVLDSEKISVILTDETVIVTRRLLLVKPPDDLDQLKKMIDTYESDYPLDESRLKQAVGDLEKFNAMSEEQQVEMNTNYELVFYKEMPTIWKVLTGKYKAIDESELYPVIACVTIRHHKEFGQYESSEYYKEENNEYTGGLLYEPGPGGKEQVTRW